MNDDLATRRSGNFCASENHRLMAGWDKQRLSRDYPEFEELYRAMKTLDKKPLVRDIKNSVCCDISGELINRTWQIIQDEIPPAGLVTYAREVANNGFYSRDPSLDFSTPHIRNGNEREEECMAKLSEKTGIDFVNTGDDQMHICIDGVGCTPDALVFDDLDLVVTGAEAKCKSPLIHTCNMLIKNNADLCKNAFDHFTQIQTSMLLTGADYWYFANYNPYADSDDLKFGYIVIERDQAFISILKERIEVAKKIKADFAAEIESKIIQAPKENIKEAA